MIHTIFEGEDRLKFQFLYHHRDNIGTNPNIEQVRVHNVNKETQQLEYT